MSIDDNNIYSLIFNGKRWGTTLDNQKNVPPLYVSRSFYWADSDFVDIFVEMTDKEKFELAFWTEEQTRAKAFYKALGVGIFVGI